jgi:hypothetical protein
MRVHGRMAKGDNGQSITRTRHVQPLYTLQAGHPCNSRTTVLGAVHPQSGQYAAVFYPFRHPTPYAYGLESLPHPVCVYLSLVLQEPRQPPSSAAGRLRGVRVGYGHVGVSTEVNDFTTVYGRT